MHIRSAKRVLDHIILIVIALALLACRAEELKPAKYHIVRYVVSEELRSKDGDRVIASMPYDGHADITYSNGDGGTSQVVRAEVPWHVELSALDGAFVYISAQAREDRGTGLYILVEIYVDGALVKKTESSGDFAIATASGRI